MKQYTFEANGFHEFYDLRRARAKAIEVAKQINEEVLVTCLHNPSYKQDWFTAYPDGKFITDRKGLSFKN